ncbi:MAG: hypothetical protein ACMVY4_01260 [Minwuia sp.]|uniref:hypothetical protein n=1 Tax=Minwuia sp. TaxID=2493630 RepID=UPI003A8BB560
MRGHWIAAAALLGLNGCGLYDFAEDQHSVDPIAVQSSDLASGSEGEATGSASGDLKPINLDVFELKVSDTKEIRFDQASNKEERREWIAFLIRRSDLQCEEHKAGTIANHATTNAILASAATIAGGAGALVAGATAARILSGTAGGLTGLRSTYNESFYQNLLATAIVKEINRLRETKKAALLARLDGGAYDTAGNMQRALLDVNEYHLLCSYYAGLVELTDDAARIRPVAANLEAQIAASKAAIKHAKGEIAEANTTLTASGSSPELKNFARDRIGTLQRTIDQQETLLRSLEIQLGLAKTAAGQGNAEAAAADTQ